MPEYTIPVNVRSLNAADYDFLVRVTQQLAEKLPEIMESGDVSQGSIQVYLTKLFSKNKLRGLTATIECDVTK